MYSVHVAILQYMYTTVHVYQLHLHYTVVQHVHLLIYKVYKLHAQYRQDKLIAMVHFPKKTLDWYFLVRVPCALILLRVNHYNHLPADSTLVSYF